MYQSLLIMMTTTLIAKNQMNYQLYTHVAQCEEALIVEEMNKKYQLQADAIENGEEQVKMFEAIMEVLSTAHTTLFKDHEWMFNLLENFFQVAYWTRKCDNMADYLACIALAFKLVTGKPVTKSITDLFKKEQNNLQGKLGDMTRQARDLFTTAEKIVDNPIVNKLKIVYTYLLVNGFLKAFGKELSTEEYMVLYAKSKKTHTEGLPVIMVIVDTALTLLDDMMHMWRLVIGLPFWATTFS